MTLALYRYIGKPKIFPHINDSLKLIHVFKFQDYDFIKCIGHYYLKMGLGTFICFLERAALLVIKR